MDLVALVALGVVSAASSATLPLAMGWSLSAIADESARARGSLGILATVAILEVALIAFTTHHVQCISKEFAVDTSHDLVREVLEESRASGSGEDSAGDVVSRGLFDASEQRAVLVSRTLLSSFQALGALIAAVSVSFTIVMMNIPVVIVLAALSQATSFRLIEPVQSASFASVQFRDEMLRSLRRSSVDLRVSVHQVDQLLDRHCRRAGRQVAVTNRRAVRATVQAGFALSVVIALLAPAILGAAMLTDAQLSVASLVVVIAAMIRLARAAENTALARVQLRVISSSEAAYLCSLRSRPRPEFRFEIVDNIDLPSVGVVLITGQNGVGKTSFLRSIAGLSEPQGIRLVSSAAANLAGGKQQVDPVYIDCSNEAAIWLPDLSYLNALSDSHLADDNARSAGEAAVMMRDLAFINAPRVVLLDEPEAHLSSSAIQQLQSLVESKARRSLVVISTHSPNLWNPASVIRLRRGIGSKVSTRVEQISLADSTTGQHFELRSSGEATL